jgi:propionyl-CoA carboxylase alpha chain/3-methylcrotonyl-CoA carboxylase alpha subunit
MQGDADPPRPLAVTRYRVSLGGRDLTVALIDRRAGLFVSVDDGPEQSVEILERDADGALTMLLGGEVVRGLVGESDTGRVVVYEGEAVEAVVLDERAARLASATGRAGAQAADVSIRAPMPGLVVAVKVEPGQAVAKGATIVVLSAMKMQNELTARADATVKDVLVAAGQTVDQNQVLVTLE